MTVCLGWTFRSFGSAARQSSSVLPASEFQNTLAARLGVPGRRLIWLDQIHGNRVAVISAPPAAAFLPRTDGCVTLSHGMAICVRTADCLPILLFDDRSTGVAALHAGWRGLLAGIVETGVTSFRRDADVPPGRLRALIGPGIEMACYEVGVEIRESLRDQFGGAVRQFFTARAGRLFLSLRRLAVWQLRRAGIPPANIHVSRLCTACMSDRLFSFRARNDHERMTTFILKSSETEKKGRQQRWRTLFLG